MNLPSEVRSRVSELLRSAEKQLISGHSELALDQLRRAQELDPENQYIEVIIQRAELAAQTSSGPRFQEVMGDAGHRSSRYLSVTVGEEVTGGGLPGSPRREALSGEETARRIRELTETAQVLLNRGLRESAFDTLMRAYLLDPLNPEVLSCEKKVLPAWEDMRRLRNPAPRAAVTPSTPADRLESLRRENLAAQTAKERHLWQTLSGPPPSAAQSKSSANGLKRPTGRPRWGRKGKP